MTTWSNRWSIVARTNANPGLTAVTRPDVGLTVATSGCDVVHATGRPVTTAPAASRAVADRVTVAPIASEGSSGSIETVLAVGVGSVGLSPPHAASAIAKARQAADLRTDRLPRETRHICSDDR
jgi:hypothetical protein